MVSKFPFVVGLRFLTLIPIMGSYSLCKEYSSSHASRSAMSVFRQFYSRSFFWTMKVAIYLFMLVSSIQWAIWRFALISTSLPDSSWYFNFKSIGNVTTSNVIMNKHLKMSLHSLSYRITKKEMYNVILPFPLLPMWEACRFARRNEWMSH